MLAAAAVLAVAVVLLALVPARLAGASWPLRAPVVALVLWQALGLAAGLLALEALVTVALAPYGRTHLGALESLSGPPPWWSAAGAVLALALLARLVSVLVRSTLHTVRVRRRHRRMVDLVSTRNPLVRGASVLESDLPVAYCLPGLRPRVVVSQGALRCLSGAEVEAVLAHERAHVDQRHDLVVLPFTALRATLPRVPAVRTAAEEVSLLVEVLADDSAARTHDRTALARALYKVGRGASPDGGLAAGDTGVLVRAGRLLDPPPPLPLAARALALAAAAAVVVLPPLGLLLPG